MNNFFIVPDGYYQGCGDDDDLLFCDYCNGLEYGMTREIANKHHPRCPNMRSKGKSLYQAEKEWDRLIENKIKKESKTK